MEVVILKIIAASAFFIAVYFLFLQKEKMFAFNRFYLLFSLVFSYAVPFVVLHIKISKSQNMQIIFEEANQKVLSNQVSSSFDWLKLCMVIYTFISLFLLIKAVISILKIKTLKGEKILYQNVKILLTDKQFPPFSFWDTIYLNKNHFGENKIQEAVFIHEKAHLTQNHSIDLLFLEIFKIFSWWNPALFFYKKAIINNHEFLADQEVLKNGYKAREYQKVILEEIFGRRFQLTHSFNFNNTKKRFIMMTFKNSRFSGIKKAGSFALLIPAFFLLVQKSYASETTKDQVSSKENNPASENFLITGKSSVISDTIKKNAEEIQKIEPKEEVSKVPKNDADIPPPPPPPVPLDKNFIQAEFPEGINEFRNLISKNFDASIFSGNEKQMKSSAYLSINEKGEVMKITIEGDNEIFNKESGRVFSQVTQNVKFIPATLEGNPVGTVVKVPLTMSFQK